MEITVHRLADLGCVMFPIWTVVADVDALGLQLHALGTFALRRHMAKPFVPHIHRGAHGDEISVAVIAGVIPVWI